MNMLSSQKSLVNPDLCIEIILQGIVLTFSFDLK